MNILQVIIISIFQGISELFPISSLGHSVILASLLHINNDPNFLAFLVALHLGTAIALLIYFRSDWIAIIKAFTKSLIVGKFSDDKYEYISWLLIIGTIPVGVIGVFLEHYIKSKFSIPLLASLFLLINGLILLFGEKLKNKDNKNIKTINKLSFKDAFFIGFSQSLALLPGISRSGIAMVSGLFNNLSHEDAAYFSFMLATPIIFSAAVLEIPTLFSSHSLQPLLYSFIGAILAGITAYLSVKFLMKYFKQGNLLPYAYYSIIVGVIFLLYFR